MMEITFTPSEGGYISMEAHDLISEFGKAFNAHDWVIVDCVVTDLAALGVSVHYKEGEV